MKKTLHFGLGALLTAALLGGVAWAAEIVNQGAPGNQGPWKVTCVSGCSGGGSVVIGDGGAIDVNNSGVIDGGIVGVNGTWLNGVLVTEFGSASTVGLVVAGGADDADNAHVLPVVQDNGTGSRVLPVGGFDRTGNFYQTIRVSNPTQGSLTTEAPCVPYTQAVQTVTNAAGNLTFSSNTNYVTLCNSQENTVGTAVKCIGSGGTAAFGTANAGDYLNVGDCVSYPVDVGTFPNTISCIANAASAALVTSECGY